MDTILDLRGLKCPQPVLRTRRAMARLPDGATLVVLCTDPMAAIDIPHWARETGAVLDLATRAAGILTFRLRRGPAETDG